MQGGEGLPLTRSRCAVSGYPFLQDFVPQRPEIRGRRKRAGVIVSAEAFYSPALDFVAVPPQPALPTRLIITAQPCTSSTISRAIARGWTATRRAGSSPQAITVLSKLPHWSDNARFAKRRTKCIGRNCRSVHLL